jgi:1,4-dihydroxy-2-naphthoyl-CoA hydrolase
MPDQAETPQIDEHASAFVSAAGLHFTTVAPERVEGWIELGPEHHTPWGVVHGGVYTTAIESAASVGASTAVAAQQQFAVGLNNSTDFLRSMVEGRVDVGAEPIQQGRVQQLWRVQIQREDGKLVALGHVRLQNVDLRRERRPPARITDGGLSPPYRPTSDPGGQRLSDATSRTTSANAWTSGDSSEARHPSAMRSGSTSAIGTHTRSGRA